MAELRCEYFTDPYDPWSWLNEGPIHKLQVLLGQQATWQYRLAGWMRDGHLAFEPEASLSPGEWVDRLARMADYYNMALNPLLFQQHPPQSTVQTSHAYHAVRHFQGPVLAQVFLRRMREAVFLEARPIETPAQLQALAREVAGLQWETLPAQMEHADVVACVQQDLTDAEHPLQDAERAQQVFRRHRFPILIVHGHNTDYVLEEGYIESFAALLGRIEMLAPDLTLQPVPSVAALFDQYPRLTFRELQLMTEKETDRLRWELLDLEAHQRLAHVNFPTGSVWAIRGLGPPTSPSIYTGQEAVG